MSKFKTVALLLCITTSITLKPKDIESEVSQIKQELQTFIDDIAKEDFTPIKGCTQSTPVISEFDKLTARAHTIREKIIDMRQKMENFEIPAEKTEKNKQEVLARLETLRAEQRRNELEYNTFMTDFKESKLTGEQAFSISNIITGREVR